MKDQKINNSSENFFNLLPQAISKLRKNLLDEPNGEDKQSKKRQPLRAEIFTREKMELHAISLAKRHEFVFEKSPEQLLKRLAENEHILLEVYALLTKNIKEDKRISPAAEWLLDNFYLIEEQIYTGKKHLPKGYSKTLPRLLKGESAGLPRVYDMAVEIISHSDGHVNLSGLTGFVNAYQTVSELKLGELWAIPIMLRLALLENLRRLSILIAEEITNKSLANRWADEMIDTAKENPKNLVLVLADMARSNPPMESTFVAELIRRLQEKGNSLSLPLNWVEQRLSEMGFTSNELIQQDNQNQAATQVSISNSISSLRFLNTTNWRDFVESTSLVEAILKQDVDGVYEKMDFNTRDNYRHAVERIALTGNLSETEVAQMVVNMAKESHSANKAARLSHVGYYLTGKGYIATAKAAKTKVITLEKCKRFSNRYPLFIYLGGIAILTLAISWGLLVKAFAEEISKGLLVALIVIIALAASHLAVAIVNWVSTVIVKPCLLPRMDFSKSIPDGARTMVVIPTLIKKLSSINELVESLEVRYLSNRNTNIYFALLTDFHDAPEEHLPGDEVLVQAVTDRIIELNKKYNQSAEGPFYLFHRPRKWNNYDKVWMGYERKRGKLGELNALLRGKGDGFFSVIVGDTSILQTFKYVITLDTDTKLPRDSAWKMTGTMAHPLNQPVYNQKKKIVVDGYTILQPRVSNSLPGTGSSFYAKMHSNEPGTDPYTKATSDVYQDLFFEGSFIGKGIYDIDAFEFVLANRFPENRILSHDLLEGCYARSGLITDVQLYEEFPMRYAADMQRRHRWIRGDWQIAKWVLPFVPEEDKKLHRNPLSFFSRWKIFDNLRRSLVPVSLLLLLLYGWIFSGSAWFWTLAVSLIIVLPAVVNFFWNLFRKPKDVLLIQQFFYTGRSAFENFLQQMLELSFLPYQVYVNTSAILQTLWRMFITRKGLLEWNPFSNAEGGKMTIAQSYRVMWFEPFFSLLVYSYLSFYTPRVLFVAVPFLIVWMLAPALAFLVSRPGVEEDMQVSEEKKTKLRMLSRRIWGFFEKFVTEEDNWLPPDNFQEEPEEKIAHRTSPTNIGLSLLSNLTAYDFGYITIAQLLKRTANTFNSLQQMKRYRGHFYNWYDTKTLAPLSPKYISTVDSGNLAGHLITLKQGLIDLPGKKIVPLAFFSGLADTVNILIEQNEKKKELLQFRGLVNNYAAQQDSSLKEIKKQVAQLEETFLTIYPEPATSHEDEETKWAKKILGQIKAQHDVIDTLAPWLLFPDPPEKFEKMMPGLPAAPTLKQVASAEQALLQSIIKCYGEENTAEENEWLTRFRSAITEAARKAKELLLITEQLAAKSMEFSDIAFDFLFEKSQNLLTIGYNTEEHRKDNGYYDLLASEARLTTYVGIVQGKIPQESWFALGRQLTNQGTTPLLLSWSGSMFEYLMPQLVMPVYENTLLCQTGKAIVQKQIEYGRRQGIPWGISESGYNMVDANYNYQYKAFGVPGTGFKRGLGEDLVISPYSTIMALMVAPGEAYDNLQLMRQEGFEGKYGFYEAVDYTASRLLKKQKRAIVKSFMAHHQGMSFLSLSYLLLNKPMQQRFEAEVHLKSALLLLQERIPRITTFYSPSVHAGDTSIVSGTDTSIRVLKTPHTINPEVQLLSNGTYHVMVTNAGGGYSRWKNIAVTRWREDATCDDRGSFCFIRNLEDNLYWSSAFQPSLQEGENYEAVFSQGRAEYRRRDFSLETHTEIVVSPEDDIELRRVHITNRSRKKKTLEITSYAEVVLAVPMADEAHPAFSNLFVQTEINKQKHALLCTRRPRSVEEKNPWMFHLMKVHDATITHIAYETDREKFIGRGNTIHQPQAMQQEAPLSNSCGSVLDPIVSIQYRIVLEGNESATIDMITGVAETKDLCNELIDKYQERHLFNRVLELAWTHNQVILRQISAVEADAQLYSRLAGSIIFSNAVLRADPAVMLKNKKGQPGLWSYGISGDIPIVLVQIEDATNLSLVKQMVQAHLYWRLKGLVVDLVIWNDDHGGYRQELQDQLQSLVAPGMGHELKDQPGGIFIRPADQISNEDRILFQTVAHIVISDSYGTLDQQMNRRTPIKTSIPYFSPTKFYPSQTTSVLPRNDLQFFNGLGGFTNDGKEYVITLKPGSKTPAPWINVLANPGFGCIISESGQSYTWKENAHEMRLTPWNNDPVTDLKGEAFYIKDEESGKFWSPTLLPCPGTSSYITRHGFGYSVFEHSEDGIFTEMTVFTDIEKPVKFFIIKIRNHSGRSRQLSVTGYMEWVLGDIRSKYLKHSITEVEQSTGAILATNAYSTEFSNKVAFFDAKGTSKTITGDRTEFIGRNGTLTNPDGLNRARLSGKTGAALDPCAVIQVDLEISEEVEQVAVFRLGAGNSREHAIQVIRATEGVEAALQSLQKVHDYWNKTLGTVQIKTPDAALNMISNGWLNYQTLASRIWGRSGFYQSGGAFGFRDQLQDVLSVLYAQPQLVRSQLLLSASRQFREGDVQHWWHPPSGRGVRTTCSDDYLWLPFVACYYVDVTNDTGVLNENIPFLEGRLLNAGEDSYYDLPIRSDYQASLYEHCVKSIEHGLRFGVHGLPLIGSGDWNDGMDKVGDQGKGESIWLAFFLYDILIRFVTLAMLKKDDAFAQKCKKEAIKLKNNIREHGWDGAWYRRAYFDDGTPLGSKENEECKIDSIAQSWAVLSGGGDAGRIETALQSAEKHLVKKEDGLIQLFNPPFDKSHLNPGYIKGYVPGVRENGGQYTHAAIWLVMAFAAMGDRKRTWELLQMINPVNRGSNPGKIAVYKTEPYVIAADVYAEPLHKGQGGWTWYTGSAGWMYQLIIGSFIGMKKKGNELSFNPCLPESWEQLDLYYNFGESRYHIHFTQTVTSTEKRLQVFINNREQQHTVIPLVNDGKTHEIKINIFVVAEKKGIL